MAVDDLPAPGLDLALALAAKGFHVFPLVPGTKFPLQEGFPDRATRDETRIRQMWNAEIGTDPLWQACNNVGIYTGRFGDPRPDGTYESLCVIDVDNKDGRNGSQTLVDLRAEGLVTPPTYVQLTPTGGFHYVYRSEVAVSNSAGSQSTGLGLGLDIRGTGGFIVGAGSNVAAGTYRSVEAPLALAHDSLISRCKLYLSRSERAAIPLASIDETAATARVREYLRTAKPAVEGAGGNAATFAVAAKCKDLGTDADTTVALMMEPDGWNERCKPPWDDYELERIVQNAFAYGRSAQGSAAPEALFTPVAPEPSNPAVEVPAVEVPAATEVGLAHSFVRESAGRVLHCHPQNRSYLWDNVRFAPDTKNAISNLVSASIAAFTHKRLTEAQARGSEDEIKKARNLADRFLNARTVRNVETLAKDHPQIAVAVEEFDRDEFLLGTPGGVIDTRTGVMRAARPSDRLSKQTGATPGGNCPRFEAFLNEAMQGDVPTIQYLKRLCGYFCTGSMRDHIIVIFYGPGGNGKGVITSVLQAALKDYARPIPDKAFLMTNASQHPTAIAGLHGARLCIGSEWPANGRMDESAVKSWTGADLQTARFMRGDFFDFHPNGKLAFVGNNRPVLSTVDAAIARRMHLVPFLNKPSAVNPNLTAELLEELPGVLRWMIEGAVEWYRDGLNPSPAVAGATDSYLASEDRIGQWLADRTASEAAAFTSTVDLFADLQQYASSNGFTCGNERQLREEFLKRGFPSVRVGNPQKRGYRGLRLLPCAAFTPTRVAADMFNLPAANTAGGAL